VERKGTGFVEKQHDSELSVFPTEPRAGDDWGGAAGR